MKKILIFGLALLGGMMQAQNGGPSTIDEVPGVFEKESASLGYTSVLKPVTNKIAGSKHLYDAWSDALVVSKEGKTFKVNNINFNAQRNRFEHKMDRETLFTFNFKALDRIVVDNAVFKSFSFPELKRDLTVQVIGDADDFKILKNYFIEIEPGSPNPMRGSVKDKYRMKDDYYLLQDGEMKKFSPKKSRVLKLLGDKASKVAKYAKDNKLSFKNDTELSKIITYYNSL